jgi:cytidylate kinase
MHIAICGELGAGCTEVGHILCKRLGLKCISSSDVIKRIVMNFRGVHPDESFKEFEKHVKSGEVNLDKMIDGIIDEFLEQGDLIIEGRSAFMLLDNKNIYRVLLVDTLDNRIEHVAKERSISRDKAKEEIRISDNERRQMVERLFKKEWLDPQNYDLIINTETNSYEQTVEIIIKALHKSS